MSKTIHAILLFLFVGLIMIDPTNNIFHLKEVSFACLLGCTFIFGQYKRYGESLIYSAALFSLALLSVLVGTIFYGHNVESSIPYFKTLIFLLIIFSLSKLTIDEILKYNYYIGLGLSIYVSLLYILMTYNIYDVTGIIDSSNETNKTIMIAWRSILGFDVLMFFYKTIPFSFFALAYAVRRNNIISIIIIGFSIFIGGSRTPILMGAAIIGWGLYSKKYSIIRLLSFALIFGLFYLFLQLTSSKYVDAGDLLKYQTMGDLLHYSSVLPHGVGALYFSTARHAMVGNSEVTYFEMLYHYGWALFPIVIYIFFSPFFKMFKSKNNLDTRDFAFAYLMYLINAGTNPLLINSTGIYVFACALIIMAKVKSFQKVNISKQLTK